MYSGGYAMVYPLLKFYEMHSYSKEKNSGPWVYIG